MKLKMVLFFLCFPALAYTQTNLESHFNLCLEFGAPTEVVRLYQDFITYKGENNGTISHVAKKDYSLIKDKPYSEYQIWYTIDKELGLYQSTLILRGDKPVLQQILTSYLKKFSDLHGEPVYTQLENGSLLVFWYNETTFTVKARLILDVVNSYKFVSVTYCSPQMKHTHLLRTLYNGATEEERKDAAGEQAPLSAESSATPEPSAGQAGVDSDQDAKENEEDAEDSEGAVSEKTSIN